MTEPLTVRRVEVAQDDAPAFLADVASYARLCNAVCSHDTGHDDLSTMTVAEGVGMLRDRTDREHELFLAERGDRLVGAATTMVLVKDPEALEIDPLLDPAAPFDVEVADALLAAALGVAAEHGLDVLQTWSLHRPVPPRLPLVPSTGSGEIDGAAPLADFLLSRGFTLEQVERTSRFDLQGPFDRVDDLLAEALAAAGPDYRVQSFVDACPDDLVDSYAQTMSRMATDAPQGGLTVEADPLDAARMRRREGRLRAQGLTSSVVVVVHTPTGQVAAYNELIVGEDGTEPIHQYGTLVLPEHRGHRLGMVVKCAGLLRVHELAPDSPVVATFNAEENEHMLAINVEVGFVPASYAGAWKRVSAASGSAGRSGSTGS